VSDQLWVRQQDGVTGVLTDHVLPKQPTAEYGLASDQQQDAAEYLGRVLEPDSTGRAR
jgi:hypothetical protein